MFKKIAVISLLFLFSCGNKNVVPDGILKPAKMQVVLWDILRADAYTFEFIKNDTLKKPEAENVKMQQQIFTIHQVTKKEFYNSYEYYKKHPDKMQVLLDSIINKATRDKYTNTKGTIWRDSLKAN